MQFEPMRHKRVAVTESTRQILCAFAAANPQQPLPAAQNVDWVELFAGVCRNGLLGLVYRRQKADPGQLPAEFETAVADTCRLNLLQMAMKRRRVALVLQEMRDAGLNFLLVKGPAVAATVYPEPNLRDFNDLDIVVRERDWNRTHRLLLKLGFFQWDEKAGKVTGQAEPPPKLSPQMVTYELTYLNPGLELSIEVHFDDLLNAGLASRDVEGFWQRTRWIEIEGVPVRVLSAEDQLVHLCAHLHYHGYTRLNALTDIALMVRDHGDSLDWARVLEIVRVEEVQVGMFATLQFMSDLLNVAAPPEVMAQLRPDAFRRWWHRRLLPPDKVRSLAPMWRPDFSFYFTPLYKRLLPDLLVMGRRREKAGALLRLLAPPAGWLRYYYQIEPARPLWPHYLAHPIKLAAHYVLETVNLLLGRPTGHDEPEDNESGEIEFPPEPALVWE